MVGSALLDGHPVLSEVYDSWLRGEDYFPVLKGDLLKSYYDRIKIHYVVPEQQTEDFAQYGYFIAGDAFPDSSDDSETYFSTDLTLTF